MSFWERALPFLGRASRTFSSRAMMVGGSCATLGLFAAPSTRELIDNFKAVTPAKVNLVIGIGLLLFSSNAVYFVWKYYQHFYPADKPAQKYGTITPPGTSHVVNDEPKGPAIPK